VVHPRQVDAAFEHGKSKNWFGGNSNASTQLLDALHYRGLVRIARREGGVRLYAAPARCENAREGVADSAAAFDALADVIVHKYAPLPERTLAELVLRLRYAAPQWAGQRQAALARAKARLPKAQVAGLTWYWPSGENPSSKRHVVPDQARLLTPFDPVVWDRRRFEALWGWAYRFEAYTPAPKRLRGYYALPLLWGQQVIGWGNVSVLGGALNSELGYVAGAAPRSAAFKAALQDELQRLRTFLALA
jgi:uncharacterized protein